MWIARDAEGLLHLYEKKPIKTIYGWYATCGGTSLPSYLFPEVKWEDKEPRELILKYLCKTNKSNIYILTNKGIKNDCFINWNTYICNVISFDMKI